MISHVHIGITDFPRAFAFYNSLLSELGLELKFRDDTTPWAGWMRPGLPRPLFLIGVAFNGQAATPGNGQMIALLSPNRATIDRCFQLALARGGSDEGQPGLRPHYHPDYYGAYVRDPDGNKLCICCHDRP